MPPLRLRKGDILELAQYFLSRHQTRRGRYTMTPAAVDALMSYDWPGNVRELERMIEGAVAIAESRHIRLDDLPVSLRGDYADVLMPSAAEEHSMRAWGSRYVRLMLERVAGQQARGVPPAGHQLPHAQGLPVIPARATAGGRAAPRVAGARGSPRPGRPRPRFLIRQGAA